MEYFTTIMTIIGFLSICLVFGNISSWQENFLYGWLGETWYYLLIIRFLNLFYVLIILVLASLAIDVIDILFKTS